MGIAMPFTQQMRYAGSISRQLEMQIFGV